MIISVSVIRPSPSFKSELAPTYSLSDEDIFGNPHRYTRYCYYYWEGSYGQIVRETVGIVFRRVDVDNWSMSKYNYEPSEQQMVQDPTKPLPAVPAQPSKEQIMEEIKNYLPERYSLYEVTAINKLDFPEPKFDWYGADYEWGGYKYSGKVNFTWKKKSSGSQGIGLSSLLSAVRKEKKVCDCVVTMLYGIVDNKWHAEFGRLNVIEE